MNPTSVQNSPRTFTRASPINSATGLVASGVPSAITPQTVLPAAFNGTEGPGLGGLSPYAVARTISVTTAAHAATYKTGASFPIVVTGTFGGAVVTESLLLTATNGGETIKGSQSFDTITSIAIPAQNDALGAFTFGVQKICSKGDKGGSTVFRAIKGAADGNLVLVFQGGFTDTLPCKGGQIEPVEPMCVDETTSIGVTVYV